LTLLGGNRYVPEDVQRTRFEISNACPAPRTPG
jgi:hypothetical protein